MMAGPFVLSAALLIQPFSLVGAGHMAWPDQTGMAAPAGGGVIFEAIRAVGLISEA